MTDWQDVVDRHSGVVWQAAFRLLGRPEEAADCYQETFLAALKLSRTQEVRNWPALLRRLAICRALDRLRKRLRHTDRHDELADWTAVPDGNPGPLQELQATELAGRLRKALAELPPKQAEVFSLRCISELSYEAIAEQLGLKRSAVGVLLHRARRTIRELLAPAAVQQPEVLP